MNFDPKASESELRKQLHEAIDEVDVVMLKKIVSALNSQKLSDLAKESEVVYGKQKDEPEVPHILKKPPPEELSRILKERADKNETISSEEMYKRLLERFE